MSRTVLQAGLAGLLTWFVAGLGLADELRLDAPALLKMAVTKSVGLQWRWQVARAGAGRAA